MQTSGRYEQQRFESVTKLSQREVLILSDKVTLIADLTTCRIVIGRSSPELSYFFTKGFPFSGAQRASP